MGCKPRHWWSKIVKYRTFSSGTPWPDAGINLAIAPFVIKYRSNAMRRFRFFGPIALAMTLSVSAFADEGTAGQFVKGKQAELGSLIKAGPGSAKKIEIVFDSILDYDALAQDSLREQWAQRSEAERKEFQEVLKQLVQRAYRKNLDRTANYDVRFEGQTPGEKADVVRTVAQNRKNAREEPVSIDYVVHRVGGGWRIRDIVTEGSSLVNNYHQQFTRIIKKDGFAELMRRMRNKLAKGESGT